MGNLSFTIAEAAFVAFMYYIMTNEMKPVLLWVQEGTPIFLGTIFGLFFGDLKTGLILGGTLMMLYIANQQPGANISQDESMACCVAIPIALKFGLEPAVALTIAIPFGVLGVPLDNITRLLMGVWTRRAEKHIDELNFKKLTFDATIGPALMRIPLRFLPMFVLIMIGGNSAEGVLELIPANVLDALSVLGGVLPCLGLVLCLRFIGRPILLPYFIGSFIIQKICGLNALTFGVLAACAAALHYLFVKNDPEFNLAVQDDEEELEDELEESRVQSPYKGGAGILPKRYHIAWPFKVGLLYRNCQSLEYYFATGYMHLMMPILRFLYKDQPEELKAALHRHNIPFVSTLNYGDVIWGSVIAMEEAKSQGEDVNPDSITALKTGLMGPIAGVGDTLNWATIEPLFKLLGATIALTGSVAGNIGWIGMGLYLQITELVSYDIGYRVGCDSILKLLKNGKANLLIMVASVLGTCMIGSMVSENVTLQLALSYTSDGVVHSVQEIIDGILPGALVLLYSLGIYIYLLKGKKYIHALVATIIAVVALALIGIL